jgi:hypothetical protein
MEDCVKVITLADPHCLNQAIALLTVLGGHSPSLGIMLFVGVVAYVIFTVIGPHSSQALGTGYP